MTRVLISGGLATGGVQTHVSLLAGVLRRAGADVTVAANYTQWPADLTAGLRATGVRVLTTPFGAGRWARLGKAQAMATWPLRLDRGFDTLYCHGCGRFHGWMLRFVRPGGAAIYHEISDSTFPGYRAAGVPLGRMTGLIGSSAAIADGVRRAGGGRPVRTIPFLTSLTDAVPPPPRGPVVGRPIRAAFLGRLARHKGIDWLVAEWGRLTATPALAGATLDVYGDDSPAEPLLAELPPVVAAGGFADRVRFHGAYRPPDLAGILANADVVLLPSRYEGLPLVLVEAMLAGVPFVVAAAGGVAELANPDVEVTPVGDRPAFAAALAGVADRLATGLVDARRLHAWADQRYSSHMVGRRWVDALTRPAEFFSPTNDTESG